MIQIPIEAIYILIALTVSGLTITGIIYHYKKLAKVRTETELEVKKRISRVDIEGNVIKYDGGEFVLRKYENQIEYDMMNVAIFGKEDVFLFWRAEAVQKLKREIVKELPFSVHDDRVQGTNIRKLRITTYLGAESG